MRIPASKTGQKEPGIRSSCCHLYIQPSLQWPRSMSMCLFPANSSNMATTPKLSEDEVRHRVWPSASWARRSTLARWPPMSLLREDVALPKTSAMPPKPHHLTHPTGLSLLKEPNAPHRLLLAGLPWARRHHNLESTATSPATKLVIQAPRPRAWA